MSTNLSVSPGQFGFGWPLIFGLIEAKGPHALISGVSDHQLARIIYEYLLIRKYFHTVWTFTSMDQFMHNGQTFSLELLEGMSNIAVRGINCFEGVRFVKKSRRAKTQGDRFLSGRHRRHHRDVAPVGAVCGRLGRVWGAKIIFLQVLGPECNVLSGRGWSAGRFSIEITGWILVV